MPLFGVTIGLSELRERLALQLHCHESAAWAILWRKLRRGEIAACCEWGYSAQVAGRVVIAHRLSPEPWIYLTREDSRIDWDNDAIHVGGSQATDIRFASAVYFFAAELDFLNEVHELAEVEREAKKSSRSRTGPAPEKHDAIKDRILHALREGRDIRDDNHEACTKDFGQGASRATVVKALRAALSEFNTNKNSDAH